MKTLLMTPCFLFCTFLAYAQKSSFILQYNTGDAIAIADKVENKLLAHISSIQKHKISPDITLFDMDEFGIDCWCGPMSLAKYMTDTIPKEHLKTYKYRLDLSWNKNLDTAFVMGFSREYYMNRHLYSYSEVELSPLYEVVLNQYSRFLNKEETLSLYDLIEKGFNEYFEEEPRTVHDKTQSFLSLYFSKMDSLSQMPWAYWVRVLRSEMKQGALSAFDDPSCNYPLTRMQLDSALTFDEKAVTETGEDTIMRQPYDFGSILISLKWSFDTVRSAGRSGLFAPLAISFKIESILLEPVDNEFTYSGKSHNLWLRNSDIEKVCSYYGGHLHLYNDLIKSAIYRKLNLKYN